MQNRVSTDTIIRTIVLAVALVNQILTSCGKNPIPFSDEEIYEVVSMFITVGASIWAWWKNNSFTPDAIEADNLMKISKSYK